MKATLAGRQRAPRIKIDLGTLVQQFQGCIQDLARQNRDAQRQVTETLKSLHSEMEKANNTQKRLVEDLRVVSFTVSCMGDWLRNRISPPGSAFIDRPSHKHRHKHR